MHNRHSFFVATASVLFFMNCYTNAGTSPGAPRQNMKESEAIAKLSWEELEAKIDTSSSHLDSLLKAEEGDFPPSDTTSLALLNFINQHQPDTLTFLALRHLATRAIQEKDYDSAVMIYQAYQPRFVQFNKWIDETLRLLTKNEQDSLKVTNIGASINTDDSEYTPIISYDGRTLYFGSKKELTKEGVSALLPQIIEEIKAEFGDLLSLLSEDMIATLVWKKLQKHTPELVFYATWDSTTATWGERIRLESAINDMDGNQAPMSISADNQTLVLFGNYECPFNRGNLYYSTKTMDGWGKPVYYPSPINSNNFESSMQLTSDGLTALFVSDRPGSVGPTREKGESYCNSEWGNLDIYVATRNDSGWNEPINLGATINTPFCENTPFLHPDGRTLYFSSNGHPGFGGLDVYFSKRLSDSSWTEWSKPQNLGKLINTEEDEWGYRINTEGNLAYFSSETGGYGAHDIYTVEIPRKVGRVVTITGTVADENGEPLSAEIKWVELGTNKIVGNLKSDIETGEYFIYLPAGKKYIYYPTKAEYFSPSKSINLKARPKNNTYREDIVMTFIPREFEPVKNDPTAPPPIFDIHSIFFDFNKSEITRDSEPELNRLVDLAKQYGYFNIEIIGHTDNVGSLEFNQQLSEKRAAAVKIYLIKSQIDSSRVESYGRGETKPIATNETEEGQSKNRRVEFKFVQKVQSE